MQTAALAPAKPAAEPKPQTGAEPTRHRVERGETAFTVARLYNVPVKALAEWNGLGSELGIREGQFLLIPVAQQAAPKAAAAPKAPPLPGAGSPTPTPPSAKKALPEDKDAKPVEAQPEPKEPVADVGKTAKPKVAAKMTTPVQGSIIRAYKKGKNEGIDIKGAPGAAVKAADTGVVAHITNSSAGVPIIILRHPGNLVTVYANVTDLSVKKGDSIKRGQSIAKLRSGNDAFVHFEIRDGVESVDPAKYLN